MGKTETEEWIDFYDKCAQQMTLKKLQIRLKYILSPKARHLMASEGGDVLQSKSKNTEEHPSPFMNQGNKWKHFDC